MVLGAGVLVREDLVLALEALVSALETPVLAPGDLVLVLEALVSFLELAASMDLVDSLVDVQMEYAT